MAEMHDKLAALKGMLAEYPAAIVAFSGGLDSTFLLAVATQAMGEKVLGVTATSPSMPRKELEETATLAKQIGAKHLVIQTSEMENPEYTKNPTNRCYHCKTELYSKLDAISKKFPQSVVLNGINLDDTQDYRPGMQACAQWNVRSPLRDAKLTKHEIRMLSKEMGLPVWDKPASPCLSSRIPYGQEVTEEKLKQIERGEEFLRGLGIREMRLRHHGDVARIEVSPQDFETLIKNGRLINMELKKLGFKFVAMDLIGFRTGALNEVLIPWNKNI